MILVFVLLLYIYVCTLLCSFWWSGIGWNQKILTFPPALLNFRILSWHRIFTFSDCSSLETFDKETGTLEIHSLNCSAIWCWDGDARLYSHCIPFMVSICINIPNSSYVQPGFQSRAWDLSNSCWKQSQHCPMIYRVAWPCQFVFL